MVPWTWIAVSTVTCTYLAARLIRSGLDGSLFILSLIFAFGYVVLGEDAFWRPARLWTGSVGPDG